MRKIITIIMILCFSGIQAQYMPDAGRITPLTENASFSASGGTNLSYIYDNNINSYWESESVLPENYITNPVLNDFISKIQYEFINRNRAAFDKNTNTKIEVNDKRPDEKYRFNILLNTPCNLFIASLKLNINDTVKIFVETTKGFHLLKHLLPTDSYQLKKIQLNDYQSIKNITLVSNSPFDVFEIAALDKFPEVFAEADFKTIVEIGQIYSRHLCGQNVLKSEILISNDHKNWTKIIDLHPDAIAMVPIVLAEPVYARFLRLVHTLDLSDYGKATIWELKVYDRFGPFGRTEKMIVNSKTMRDRIGVNGFWGWGFNTYSDNIPLSQGADKYFKIGNLARSYHNMVWDIIKPGDKTNFDEMKNKGTNVHDWLNWDREYSVWKKAGFKIDASIQFQQVTVHDSLWKSPFDNAYQYGFEFADHFGNKNNFIELIEVGNEPWDYPDGFYSQILDGMSNGIKAANSSIKVYPAAFQATFKAYEKYEYDNYIGSKLNSSVLKNLDGLNGHFYSHTFDEKGNRMSVNPEDPRSDLLGIRNLNKFRNVNLPGKPLIITEFGYDSDGGGEMCDHQECVTEDQQAAWGLRAALLLLRNNADAVYWYFFANENRNSVLHSRSGLCSSASKSFEPKKSYRIFAEFQELLGDCILKEVISETPELFCYLFVNQSTKTTFAVIWSISNNNPVERKMIKYNFPSEPVAVNYLDDNLRWILLSANKREIDLEINGFPLVIQLK